MKRGELGKTDPYLVMAVLEHVKEGRAAPVLRGVAIVGRAVFEGVALVGVDVVPAKPAAFIDRMQGIDEDEGARQVQPLVAAALAEAAAHFVLGQAGETLADQPVHQTKTGREFHTPLCRAIAPDGSSRKPPIICRGQRPRRPPSQTKPPGCRADRTPIRRAGTVLCPSASQRSAG